ncbi:MULTISPECIES: hypothetical protein [unclassified Gordonia (in: high G+C Gram-positive bacteria)]|uniref:hypothetical protein n=1 Tax=unclassified Gordonia (in: high G+C Gram-positive bacteria) TaxID=2657482 RepID=UPI0020003252|nr:MULTISPECIES: hypothetical protein [unclassified Gordonia (in: high G+C Gram-positive bacteria)]UQE75348.1 hypothetical protein MYK68_01565 [Gordonia sp. PP30]
MGSIDWGSIPIIGDLGHALAGTGAFQEVWIPVWNTIAVGVNSVFGQDILWHQ